MTAVFRASRRSAVRAGNGALLAAGMWVLLTLSGSDVAVAGPLPDEAHEAARTRLIESHLRAPCCWNQTLDVHDSELTRTLHREIADRVAGGEATERIELDLVARYGERIRAVPLGSPLQAVALGALMGIALAGLGLWRVARRWRRASPDGTEVGGPAPADGCEDYEARLERELAKL